MSKERLQMEKNNEGITLIALIITIVIMLVLVVVTLAIALGDNGVINTAKDAKEKQELAQKEDEITTHFSIDYSKALLDTYDVSKSVEENTVEEIAKLCIDANISPEKLAIHYNLYNAKVNETNGNNNLKEEFILYRIDKVTPEERTILEEKGIKPLRGDADLNGYITKNDFTEIDKIMFSDKIYEDLYIELCDLNEDFEIDSSDLQIMYGILYGTEDYQGGYIF